MKKLINLLNSIMIHKESRSEIAFYEMSAAEKKKLLEAAARKANEIQLQMAKTYTAKFE